MGIIQAQQEGQRLTTLTGFITSVREDVWWRVLGVNEGDVNCGSIEEQITKFVMWGGGFSRDPKFVLRNIWTAP